MTSFTAKPHVVRLILNFFLQKHLTSLNIPYDAMRLAVHNEPFLVSIELESANFNVTCYIQPVSRKWGGTRLAFDFLLSHSFAWIGVVARLAQQEIDG